MSTCPKLAGIPVAAACATACSVIECKAIATGVAMIAAASAESATQHTHHADRLPRRSLCTAWATGEGPGLHTYPSGHAPRQRTVMPHLEQEADDRF